MPVIATNTSANSALRYLNINSDEQTNYLNRIASGSKITKASDDAAGLAVATKLQADVAVLGQAETNASHAQSILETADGGLSQISDILQRMKTLAAQSISGAVTNSERAYLQDEWDTLMEEITSIVNGTTFNGEQLLGGTQTLSTVTKVTTGGAKLTTGGGNTGTKTTGTGAFSTTKVTGNVSKYMVGTDSKDDVITVKIESMSLASLGLTSGLKISATSTLTSLATATMTKVALAAEAVDAALDKVAGARASVGSQMSRFEYQAAQLAIQEENLDAAQSAIVDADVAEEQSNFSSAQVKTNAAIAALSQANQMPQQLLQLLG
jgi:flagellin